MLNRIRARYGIISYMGIGAPQGADPARGAPEEVCTVWTYAR